MFLDIEALAASYNTPVDEMATLLEMAMNDGLTEVFRKPVFTEIDLESQTIDIQAINHTAGICESPVSRIVPENLGSKALRHVKYHLEKKLKIRQVVNDYDSVRFMRRRLISAQIDSIRDKHLHVIMPESGMFGSNVLYAVCPHEFQPPYERATYHTGMELFFIVERIEIVEMSNKTYAVGIVLSRNNWALPIKLLKMHTPSLKIKCVKRVVGRVSYVASEGTIPRETIQKACKDLGERIVVESAKTMAQAVERLEKRIREQQEQSHKNQLKSIHKEIFKKKPR
ncbi:hypothetical protein FY034_17305 (plasmid) [Trichlorobacter lovleyi]|uniref:hypothetical protein n=1 Tax=Trichlorobacter lovleyi TaxID=313985 RepID=UPI00223ECC2C|nr:hypothetical protein [Trichlorobacter lovleyi]QOX80781.1 hypothetical protein FY034_17305 [Trichlorobacter lovleyi]